jgi:predicted methyltransferase
VRAEQHNSLFDINSNHFFQSERGASSSFLQDSPSSSVSSPSSSVLSTDDRDFENNNQNQNCHEKRIFESNSNHLLLLLKRDRKFSDLCTLLNHQDQSLKQYYTTLRQMETLGWIEINQGEVFLTLEGEKRAPKETIPLLANACEKCQTRGFSIDETNERFLEVLEKYKELVKDRPAAEEQFDQWFMSPEHALFRVSFLYTTGNLLNKKILIIGDDDLLGLACALTGLPSEVIVLEIDQRIIDFNNEIAKQHNLNLSARQFDAREPLPDDLAQQYDVFASDPVETVEGCKLFLSRGIASLKGPGSTILFGLTSMESGQKKWYDVQRLLLDMNFAVLDVVRNFTEYPDPGWEERLPIWKNLQCAPTSTWYKSCLFRAEAVRQPKPVIAGVYDGDWNIFIDSESWATTSDKV